MKYITWNDFFCDESGPRRYEYNPKSKCWENTRDKTELKDLLKREIEEAIGASVRL